MSKREGATCFGLLLMPVEQSHLHSPRLNAGLVAEFDQCHQHGQTQPTNQDVEHPGHIAEAQGAGLILSARGEEADVKPQRKDGIC